MKPWKLYTSILTLMGLACCATTSWDYQEYVIHPESNKLEGKTVAEDLDLAKTCTPDPECLKEKPDPNVAKDCAKCYALMRSEYYKLKDELLTLRALKIDLEKQLKECKQGGSPLAEK
jgi:hypothetical protein